MMRKVLLIAGCATLLLVLVGTATLLLQSHTPTSKAATNPACVANTSSLGPSAIKPSLTSGSVCYTESDVRDYIAAHPTPPGLLLAQGATTTIVSVNFETALQAGQTINEPLGGDVPDTEMVCVVQLHGPFSMRGISMPAGAKVPPNSDTATEVFDGQTGNLLVMGTP